MIISLIEGLKDNIGSMSCPLHMELEGGCVSSLMCSCFTGLVKWTFSVGRSEWGLGFCVSNGLLVHESYFE